MYTYLYIHVYTYTYIYTYIYIYTDIIPKYIYMYIYMNVCTYTFIYSYTYVNQYKPCACHSPYRVAKTHRMPYLVDHFPQIRH